MPNNKENAPASQAPATSSALAASSAPAAQTPPLTTTPSFNPGLMEVEDSMFGTLTKQHKTFQVLPTKISKEKVKKERREVRASTAEAKIDKVIEKLRKTHNQLA